MGAPIWLVGVRHASGELAAPPAQAHHVMFCTGCATSKNAASTCAAGPGALRGEPSLRALPHLPALLLEAARALLLPLPAEHGPRLFVGVALVRHASWLGGGAGP